MNGQQIFVRHSDVAQVKDLIRSYVKEVGCAAAMGFESDDSDPVLERRRERVFTLSEPRDGLMAIWEDGAWGDKRLARYLSKELETQAIWLGVSSATDSWAYVTYDTGAKSDSKVEETDEFYESASAFARRRNLPFALVYLPDPNAASDVAKIKQAMGDDWMKEPDTGELEIEYETVDEDDVEADAAEIERIQAEDDRRAKELEDVRRFPSMKVPCKGRK